MALRITAKQLVAMSKDASTPRTWVLDRLLRTRTKRPSLLCGFAESGKSTLSTQLAIAVAQGKEFLGRRTLQGPVIVWKYESTKEEAKEEFEKAGMRAADPIDIVLADEGENEDEDIDDKQAIVEKNIGDLLRALKERPDAKLVIIETLSDFFNPQDITSNDEGRRHLREFRTRITSLYPDCIFLILHHYSKKDLEVDVTKLSIGKVLGGQCYVAGTETKIYMQQVSDSDQRRILFATTRKGLNIEPTYLDFDPTTAISTLGTTVREERSKKQEVVQNKKQLELDEAILGNSEANPGIAKWDLVRLVGGSSERVGKRVKALIAAGDLMESEPQGKSHAKLIYRKGCLPIPMEDGSMIQPTQEGGQTL